MPIQNRDGSTFRLQGPNPAMIGQNFWDDGQKAVLHNFDRLEDVQVEEVRVVARESPKPKPKPKDVRESLVTVYCMPATQQEQRDDLYGEVRSSVRYGDQFTFEAVVVVDGDLSLQLWSNVPAVQRSSVLFLPKDRRWWRVDDVTARDGGFMFTCGPSAVQPAFST